MAALTEVELKDATFDLSFDSPYVQQFFSEVAPTSGSIWRVVLMESWSQAESQALFYAAAKAGGCPEITLGDAGDVIRANTPNAIREAIHRAAEEAIDALLACQRHVM
jgi:hypothetical protein